MRIADLVEAGVSGVPGADESATGAVRPRTEAATAAARAAEAQK